MISVIKSFPAPIDFSNAQEFFGQLIQWNQRQQQKYDPTQRSGSRPNSCFAWKNELKRLLEEYKHRIFHQVSKGVNKYDTERVKCLQTDFSKGGVG